MYWLILNANEIGQVKVIVKKNAETEAPFQILFEFLFRI